MAKQTKQVAPAVLRQRKAKDKSDREETREIDNAQVEEEGFSCFHLCLAFLFIMSCLCIIAIGSIIYLSPSISFNGSFSTNTNNKRAETGKRTRDQAVTLEVPLEDIYFGNTVQFDKPRVVLCSACDGRGIRPDVDIKECSRCDGQGFITRIQRMGGMQYEQRFDCPVCHGAGVSIKETDKCKSCRGNGLVREQTPISIELPKGIAEGGVVIAHGYADEHPQANTGDLQVIITSQKHSFFQRKEVIHLECEAEITLLEALTGFKRKIKHLSGEMITIRRNEVTPHGEVIEFEGKGMPKPENPEELGNLFMKIKVKFPSSLPAEKLAIVQQLLQEENKS